jgi:Gly-Xaa carboxypeptidase
MGAAMIFDEGFTGVDEDSGTSFARIGIAEKGCFTLKLVVHTAGGHSS